MESENLTSIDWVEVLKQWLFFFAILAVFLFPAFKFKNLAKEYNKKGWVYFFIGLIVGIVGFNLGQIIVLPLRYYVVPEKYVVYLVLVLFLSSYLFYSYTYKFLASYFLKNKD